MNSIFVDQYVTAGTNMTTGIRLFADTTPGGDLEFVGGVNISAASVGSDVLPSFDNIATLGAPPLPPGVYGLAVQEFGDPGQQYTLNITLIPEPATLALLAVGGLAMLRRRR